jgi:heme-degrading monooxygenase HmoA
MMYFIRGEGIVPLARRGEYLAWVDRLIEFAKPAKGFQAGTVTNSLGYITRFGASWRWESRDAFLAWLDNPQTKQWMQANLLGDVYTATRPAEAYEPVVFERGQGNFGFASIVDVTIDFRPGNNQAFENRCRELINLYQKHGKGVVVAALLRSLAGGGRYTIAWGHTTQADAQATFNAPQIAQFREKNPLSNYTSTPPVVDQVEVVRTVVLQPASVR